METRTVVFGKHGFTASFVLSEEAFRESLSQTNGEGEGGGGRTRAGRQGGEG